jgi:translation initiation factor 1 (eIF-1/SUI1)
MEFSSNTTDKKDRTTLEINIETVRTRRVPTTSISGLTLDQDELETIKRSLAKLCSCGVSLKNGVFLLQGDQRHKVVNYLVTKEGISESQFSYTGV